MKPDQEHIARIHAKAAALAAHAEKQNLKIDIKGPGKSSLEYVIKTKAQAERFQKLLQLAWEGRL